MGRPKNPLIDRDEAIATALSIIDKDGLDAFSIRRLGSELGVNGASLYHHFKDKEDILRGVRGLVLAEAGVLLPRSRTATWEDYVVRSVSRYRDALVRHPNAAPLMALGAMPPTGLVRRDHLVTKMVEGGVPLEYCYAIIDSVETLAFGSALLNPRQLPPKERYTPRAIADVPQLRHAIGAAPRTPERLFRFELRAVLEGWKALIEQG